MLEINDSLKMLKEENERVLEDVRAKHQSDLEDLERLRTEEI